MELLWLAEDYKKKKDSGDDPSVLGSYFRTLGKMWSMFFFMIFIFIILGLLIWAIIAMASWFRKSDTWVIVLVFICIILAIILLVSLSVYGYKAYNKSEAPPSQGGGNYYAYQPARNISYDNLQPSNR